MNSPSMVPLLLRVANHVRECLAPYAHSRWGCSPSIDQAIMLRNWLQEKLQVLSLNVPNEEYDEYFLPLFDSLAFLTEGVRFGIVERMRINSAYALACSVVQLAKPAKAFRGRKKRARS